MQRHDFFQKTSEAGKLISGLMVLLLVLVWQAAPAFRQNRAGALPDRAVSARVLLPADAMKSLQTVLAAKAGDDRMADGPPLAGLSPLGGLPLALTPLRQAWSVTTAAPGLPRPVRPEPRAPPLRAV